MMLFSGLALADAQAEFDAGNAAYASGDLPAAEARYRAALEAGGQDADVYFNLGNTLYRQERLAPAILAWRCAGVLAPRDPDVEGNLDFARRNVADRLDPLRPVPVFAPWQSALTPGEGEWLGAALAGLGLLAIAARGRFPHVPVAALGALSLLVGGVVGAGGVVAGTMPPAAVVLATQTTARSDLGGGVDLFTLHAGAEVLSTERAGEQVLVRLPDDRRGWLPAKDLGMVDPATGCRAD